MDAFNSFVCDPVYTNHSAPGAVGVDDRCYLNQVSTDDFMYQEQQQMWLSGFMNVEMDQTRSFTPSSPVYSGDSSNFSYHPRCNGSPETIPVGHTQVSEIQVYAQVYNNDVNANGSFGAEYHPYAAAFPGASVGIQVNANLAPRFSNANNYNNVIYGSDLGMVSPPAPESFAPPSYTQYLIGGGEVYGQEQEVGFTSKYSTLSPNMVASSSEKYNYRAQTPASQVVSENTTWAKDSTILPGAVETNKRAPRSGSAGKATKSNKKPGKDGNLGWIQCTPIAVTNTQDPDSPPTYKVVSRLMVRKKPGETKSTTKGQKRPRVAVVVVGADGEEKVLHFRSCVVKYFDVCKWDGCQGVVWTDRKSIREHMEMAHGVYWNPDDRITCRWEGCKSDLSIDSLFRHITNTHMKVVRASCVYGCGEGYSRIDGRNRHSPKCSLRQSVA